MKFLGLIVLSIFLNMIFAHIAPSVDWLVRGVFIGFILGVGMIMGGSKNG